MLRPKHLNAFAQNPKTWLCVFFLEPAAWKCSLHGCCESSERQFYPLSSAMSVISDYLSYHGNHIAPNQFVKKFPTNFSIYFQSRRFQTEKNSRCQRNPFEKRFVFYCLYCSKRVKPTKNSSWSWLIEIPQHVTQKMKTKAYDFIGVDLFLRK